MNLRAATLFLVVSLPTLPPTATSISAAPAPRLDQVVVVFKTHFDIGYTDMASNVVQRYRTTMIDDALRVVDQSRSLPPEQHFVWTLPGWPMAQILADWPGQDPTRRARVLQALRDGRFVVHALPFTTHTELLEPEDLVRGLGYASRIAREAGLALARDAKMTDVPCHSWILPTLLRHAGVEFLHLGCNAASRSPEVPRIFWWEGPDGSRLLTMYTAESYGTGLVPPADWPHRTWLALIHTGDNHGPPTPEEVQELLAHARQELPGVKIRIGRLSDFSDALLAEKPDLPVVRGDMPDTWIHGPMSDPIGAGRARTTRPMLPTLEALTTQLQAWKVAEPSPSRLVPDAYEQSLLYGEHTWGGALYWVSQYDGGRSLEYGTAWQARRAQGRFQRLEASWAEHTHYIETAAALVEPAVPAALERLARHVGTQGRRIVVYNPLPWKRDGLVAIDRWPGTPGVALRDLEQNRVVPTEAMSGRLRFLAREVPPMGYRTYVPHAESPPEEGPRADAGARQIENRFFRVQLDAITGTIRSLVDRRSGRELVDTQGPQGFGQFLLERFDRDQVAAFVRAYVKIDAAWATNELGKPNLPPRSEAPYRALTPKLQELTVASSPVSATARVVFADAHPEMPRRVTLQLELPQDLPWLEIAISLEGKPADPWPEAGWLCLPLNFDRPSFRLGRLGSIIDPTTDIVRGANRHLLALNTGLGILEASGRGVGLCPLDSPLVSLGTPGCWQYSLDFVPQQARVYVNLFNNQWTTNFRLWNDGAWTSRVRLWSLDTTDPGAALIDPCLESRQPLLAGTVDQPVAGPLPPVQTGLTLSRRGVQVTAFGPNPDGAGTLLRLWEQSGQAGPCTVTLPTGLAAVRAQPVDLRGRPQGDALPVQGKVFAAQLQAFAPASFVLSPAPASSTAGGSADRSLARRILSDTNLIEVLDRAKALLKTGFNAGSGYREVWIRDFATFIELSCDVADRAELRDNLLMFLRLQADDGNIVDGFVPKSQANVNYKYIKKDSVPGYWGHKNTVETDQETSLIQAIHTYVRKTGDTALLQEIIEGRPVLDRLEQALEFLLRHRFSKPHGLLWGATTVDWGDVQPEHEWGVELDASSHRAIDIYDNAMLLIALADFVALAGADTPRAQRWQAVHDDVARNVRKHLWDPQRRKFIPHLYPEGSPFPPSFDEHAVYFFGGTAVAIQAGLLGPDDIASSLVQMRANVRAASGGSIGLTVYPPYPAGTFKNPSMVPWSYQNGGDWDWFGGRMIQALIAHGFVEDAYTELQPMLARVQQHQGFHEWWDRQNQPKGSGTFRGAAGVLGKAILMLQQWSRDQRFKDGAMGPTSCDAESLCARLKMWHVHG